MIMHMKYGLLKNDINVLKHHNQTYGKDFNLIFYSAKDPVLFFFFRSNHMLMVKHIQKYEVGTPRSLVETYF